jgi:Calcineurin-like phosphoesterase
LSRGTLRWIGSAFVAAIAVAVPAAAGTAAPANEPATLLAAGDIADCVPGDTGEQKTATIIDGYPGATVAALGDVVYENGTTEEFQQCYEPTWGRHKTRTRPAVGNHEYGTPGAAGYFTYFGAAAGDAGKGWYSYDVGSWHVVVLNSNCTRFVLQCAETSEQLEWLRDDLDAHPVDCTLAYWHHPLFTSGPHQNDSDLQLVRPFWDALYSRGVEVILVGHDHDYERFAAQTPAGDADATYGIRQFVVGTGGANLRGFGAPRANSEARESGTYGVLKLTLSPGSYAWQFLSEPGKPFTDTGTGNCHDSHDSIPPETKPTITSTHPSNWSNDDTVDVMWSGASDSGSGVNGFSYSWTPSATSDPGTTKIAEENVSSATSPPLPDGETWFHLRTVDNAGNWSDPVRHGPYRIDTIAPSTTDNAPAAWRRTAVTVTLTPYDAHSGIASTQYRVDGGAPQTGTSVVVPAPSDGSNDGVHTVTYNSIDDAGNVEAVRTATVRIDTTSPVTTDDAPTDWRRAPVTLTLHATDLHSGAAATSYRTNGGPFETGTEVHLTTDGVHTVDYRSTDAAGNVEELRTETVRIDRGAPTNPSLDSPSHDPGAWSNDPTVDMTWTDADDELSGVDGYSVAWAQSADAPVDETKDHDETAGSETSSPRPDGDWWYLLRTRDNAGNWSAAVAIGPFRIETGPPDTVIASGPTQATHSTSASFALLSENGSSFECSLDGSPFVPCSSPSNYNGLGYGPHLFQARAVDQASNRDSTPAEWRWTIVAAPPPPPPPPSPPPPPPPPVDPPPKRPPLVERCVVPRVIGRTVRRARSMISRAGCRVGRARTAYSARIRKGIVMTQGPRFGRRVPRGTRVGMVVSLGKKPAPTHR